MNRLTRHTRGTLVFWLNKKPYWIIEWQPNNGDGCYWMTDAMGDSAVAIHDDLTLTPPNDWIPRESNHPTGCSCGSPDCPEWQATQS